MRAPSDRGRWWIRAAVLLGLLAWPGIRAENESLSRSESYLIRQPGLDGGGGRARSGRVFADVQLSHMDGGWVYDRPLWLRARLFPPGGEPVLVEVRQVSPTQVRFLGFGSATRPYLLEMTVSLAPSQWQSVAVGTSDENGQIAFVVEFPTDGARYYRLKKL